MGPSMVMSILSLRHVEFDYNFEHETSLTSRLVLLTALYKSSNISSRIFIALDYGPAGVLNLLLEDLLVFRLMSRTLGKVIQTRISNISLSLTLISTFPGPTIYQMAFEGSFDFISLLRCSKLSISIGVGLQCWHLNPWDIPAPKKAASAFKAILEESLIV